MKDFEFKLEQGFKKCLLVAQLWAYLWPNWARVSRVTVPSINSIWSSWSSGSREALGPRWALGAYITWLTRITIVSFLTL